LLGVNQMIDLKLLATVSATCLKAFDPTAGFQKHFR
jgi:hypothetical protein